MPLELPNSRTVFPLNFSLRMAAGAMASTDEMLVNLRDTPSTDKTLVQYVQSSMFKGTSLSRCQLVIMEDIFRMNKMPDVSKLEEISKIIKLPRATIEVSIN